MIKYKMDRIFQLPPAGLLKPNDEINDPMPYYYQPVIGKLYQQRIENGLSLLNPPYESILEIGFGSGILLPTLTKLGKNVFGIDIQSGPKGTESALSSMGINVQLTKGDICNGIYPENSFNLIVAFSVFEHIKEPSTILSQIFNLLRSDGSLLIGMPRVNRFMAKMFHLIGFKNIHEHHVLKHRQFIKYASKHFKLIAYKTMPAHLPDWSSLYFNMLFKKRI